MSFLIVKSHDTAPVRQIPLQSYLFADISPSACSMVSVVHGYAVA
ncbi:MAG TPA: hypothetical protein O0X19_01825 [Methanocorpusculum sp.]|nr:hypothetical protein [Methanocorpusculum sp.]HJJ44319.1 hypothetical protein [Methanocorpusculum sp.]HJJ58458.1 hypothetical protein [Methanocorpusculum sp.]HJJ59441.1 hypothetical protein [Methanocorpusculum sp.]